MAMTGAERTRRHRQKNIEKHRARERERYWQNRDRRLETQRAYYDRIENPVVKVSVPGWGYLVRD
jgi:hypothetical protein